MPLAIQTDAIDQILAIALNPAYDCYTAKVSVDVMLNITQSPQAHTYIVRREVVENMLEICEQKQKMVSEQSLQSPETKKEDVVILRCVNLFSLSLALVLNQALLTCTQAVSHSNSTVQFKQK